MCEDKRSIIVTGAAGFIGSNLVEHLLEHARYRVIAFDKLTYAGNLQSLATVKHHPCLKWVQADINDAKAVRNVFDQSRPAGLIHLAAETHVDRSIDGPEEFIQTNIVGTYRLLQESLTYYRALPAALRGEFRFHHVSTDEVFGSLDHAERRFSETTAYDPHSPYSASKAASDHLVRAWGHTYGLPTLITNCSNNYGPYQFPEKLIPVVILRCLRDEPIPVYGTGNNVRDWLFVQDHCDAIRTVFETGRVGETYNVGGDNEWQNIDLVREICSILDRLRPRDDGRPHASRIEFVPDRPGHDRRYAIDATKIREQLGWTPQEASTTGFEKTVLWYLDHQEWWQNILNGDYKLHRMGRSGQSPSNPH